jgi:hypothetical protein
MDAVPASLTTEPFHTREGGIIGDKEITEKKNSETL